MMLAVSLTGQAVDEILARAGAYLQIDGYYTQANEVNIRGAPLFPGEKWQGQLRAELLSLGYRSGLSQRGSSLHLTIYPATRKIPWLNILLFLATVISVSIAPGFLTEGPRYFRDFELVVKWLHFSIPLLLILLVHEFGHYFAARHSGVRASLPYFIPMINLFGTWGAFIKMRSAMPTRWELLKIGAAGPIAGFLLAVVILGFSLAEVTPQPLPQEAQATSLIEPLIFRIASAFLEKEPIPDGYAVFLFNEPLLLAAWVGMFLTMLNLFPIAQLDGGHIVYALLPRKHHLVSRAMLVLMVAAGFLWAGWWFFGVLVFLFLRLGHPPTLNDAAPLRARGKVLGWLAILIFVLTFTPRPF